MSLADVQQQVETWRKQGLNVVFTNGVFDVLHVGHVAVLEAAARQGHRLVVGVNSTTACDASARAPTAPFIRSSTGRG